MNRFIKISCIKTQLALHGIFKIIKSCPVEQPAVSRIRCIDPFCQNGGSPMRRRHTGKCDKHFAVFFIRNRTYFYERHIKSIAPPSFFSQIKTIAVFQFICPCCSTDSHFPFFRLLRDDVDDTAHGVRTVKGARCSADNFHPVDTIYADPIQNIEILCHTCILISHTFPIHQNQCVIRIHTAEHHLMAAHSRIFCRT